MKSNIINLGDYTMDEKDRVLRELFAHPPLADDGFSRRVMKRIRRRALLRRSLLPAALLAGVLIAAQPVTVLLSGLVSVLAAGSGGLLENLAPGGLLQAAAAEAQALPGGVFTALGLFGAALAMMRLLEE